MRVVTMQRCVTQPKDCSHNTTIMSQATVVGLYSGNVVTILHPSSTINCWPGYYGNATSVGPISLVDSSMNIIFNTCATILLSGNVAIDVTGGASPSYVKVAIGQFVAQTPVPAGYVGPVLVPFQTTLFCPTTATLVVTATTTATIRVSYSTLQLG